MKKIDVITLGETMIVFNPLQITSFADTHQFMKQIGGAESNFAIGLSRMGHSVGWVSRLSDDSLGYYVNNILRGNGVDTSLVEFDDRHPTGILIKERLIQNQVNVHYYRKETAASFMSPAIINEEYFSQAKYLFLTGITPALSDSCEEMVFEAIQMSKKLGLKIIFDPNIRMKLFDDAQRYKDLLNKISSMADYFMPGREEAKFLCGSENPEKIWKYYQKLNRDITLILKLGKEGCYYANKKENAFVKGYKVDNVVDPIGAGDGFAAGFVSGLLEGKSMKEALSQANLLGAILIQTNGDIEGFPHKKQFENFKEYILQPSKEEVNR